MTENIVTRIRTVFEDTPEVLSTLDVETYEGAEAHTHMLGMWETMKEAADRIEQLENGFVDILLQQPLDLVVAMIAKACLVGAIDKNGKYCFVGNLKIVDGKPSMEKTDD